MVMKHAFLVLNFAFIFSTTLAFAKSADSIPLQFQVDKNNIQILPQRFEYNLVDEDHIKIGDIVIDSTTFGFQISSKPEPNGKFRARFIWPAGLLKDGTLSIRDNTGKSIWSVAVNRKNTRIINTQDGKGSAKDLQRNQLTEFVTDQFEVSRVEDMKYFPFMNFCINRTTQDTNIYLCSKELYLGAQPKLAIRSRAQGRRQAFVEINGKSVGNQGIIFLNDEKENIGFRAMTQSGAILEVETRMKPVDFKDVVLSEDKKSLILTASGAEPVNEDRVKRISDEEWQYEVDAQRPILYLKGEGEIPMRQEFYVKGKIPTEAARPYLPADAIRRVYQPQLKLQVESASGTTVSPTSANQQLEKIDENHQLWTISDIPNGQTSRHFLRVTEGDSAFTAAYDIYRDYAFEGGAIASYWVPASQMYATLYANWWIENLFGIENAWSRLHWGARAEQSLNVIQKDGEVNLSITHLELIWRAKAGFHFVDPTWGLTLPVEILQATGTSTTSPGVGVFYSAPAPAQWQKWMKWYDAKFVYLLGGSGTIQLKSAVQLQTLGYYHVDSRLSLNYGLGLSQYMFDPGQSKMQFQLLGGLSYRF
ncbi:MAG: hypothetical protein H7326_07890 [Bdellovibrionaceae bacterium]|nr:hypothetical protein [Pseudobdellovibrionaceae bacterium]